MNTNHFYVVSTNHNMGRNEHLKIHQCKWIYLVGMPLWNKGLLFRKWNTQMGAFDAQKNVWLLAQFWKEQVSLEHPRQRSWQPDFSKGYRVPDSEDLGEKTRCKWAFTNSQLDVDDDFSLESVFRIIKRFF